jgi:glutamate formiminotransferase
MGLYLPSRDCAQVSMNLTNFAAIPMEQVYQAIATEAAAMGIAIRSSQLIGLIPQRAFDSAPEFFRHADNFSASRIIETQLKS